MVASPPCRDTILEPTVKWITVAKEDPSSLGEFTIPEATFIDVTGSPDEPSLACDNVLVVDCPFIIVLAAKYDCSFYELSLVEDTNQLFASFILQRSSIVKQTIPKASLISGEGLDTINDGKFTTNCLTFGPLAFEYCTVCKFELSWAFRKPTFSTLPLINRTIGVRNCNVLPHEEYSMQ